MVQCVVSWGLLDGERIAALDGSKLPTPKSYAGCGKLKQTRSVKVKGQQERATEEYYVYGWKVLVLIDVPTRLPLAMKVVKIQEYEGRWLVPLLAQAQKSGHARAQREANFYRANLSGATLANANFSGANLMQAKLDNKTGLFGAKLINAKLIDAELIEAFLYGANLSHAILSGANLSKAALRKANLEEAYLDGANLSQTDLGEAYLVKAALVGANLTDSSLNQTNLSGANLSHANLSKVFLTDADLSGVDLSNVKSLETATGLERTDLRGVTGLTREQLEACKAKGAIIDKAPPASPAQLPVSSPPSSQSSNAQTPSALRLLKGLHHFLIQAEAISLPRSQVLRRE